MTSAIVLLGEFPFISRTWFKVVVVPGSPAAPVGFLGGLLVRKFIRYSGTEILRDIRRPRWESELIVRHNVRATDILDTICLILCLPVCPDFI
jgi:hypothetical protein